MEKETRIDTDHLLNILEGISSALYSITAAINILDERLAAVESRPAAQRCMCMNRYGSIN